MIWPTPAERGWWGNYETPTYGPGHRPDPVNVGTAWVAACACGCDRADDGLRYPDFATALDATRTNLRASEHGPAAGQEASS